MSDTGLASQLTDQIKSLMASGRTDEAIALCRRVVHLVPNSAVAFTNLAILLAQTGDYDAAIDAGRRAIELNPAFDRAHSTLASALQEIGDVEGAVQSLERAVSLAPGNPLHLSGKLYGMEFLPGITPQILFDEQRQWDVRFGKSAANAMPARPPKSRLKIGYLSAFFYRQAEAFFVLPLLESHDHSAFEIHCYSVGGKIDALTDRHRAAADHWHECRGMSNDELADQIRRDEIDILVDLMMHMGINRAPVFARRAAPVQICWLAYPGGTGISAMDFRISDPLIDPGDADSNYVERTLRLPDCWCCYDPLIDIPPAAPRPDANPITFGSLNNPRKLNDPLIQLWARTMHAVPDSRIIILSCSQIQRRRILKIFSTTGVQATRIAFVDRRSRTDYLRMYDEIDIVLDTLPYNGITTTLDALWMGVPVVTQTGQTAAGRAGSSILHAIGLPELSASDPDQFVSITAALVADRVKLKDLRVQLRARMQASPLMDAARFARNIESAYQHASEECRAKNSACT